MNAGVILIGTFFLLLVLNVPIAWSIGMSVVLYMVTSSSFSLNYLAQTMFTGCDSFTLMAIPLFILAGALMEGGGLSRRLIDFADSMVGHKRGGLAIVTILACMFFGAISGSAAATVATIGVIMVPSMIQQGYSKGFSYALIAAAGVLGVLIPPSIPFVTYGVATNASIATMFMGGFGPGILCGVLLIIVSRYICRKNGWEGNGRAFSWKRVWKTFCSAIGALLVPVIILGGIYGSIFTPTEAAAVAVFYALIVGFFIYRELNLKKLLASLSSSAVTTSTIMVIVGTATALARMLTLEKIPMELANWIGGLTDSRILVLLAMNIFLLIVGCVMDGTPAILILAPILQPIAANYGVDPIHFGLMMCLNISVGFCTPPVGLNLFVATSLGNINFMTLCKRIVPFLIALIVGLLLVTYIPAIPLCIPWLFGYGS